MNETDKFMFIVNKMHAQGLGRDEIIKKLKIHTITYQRLVKESGYVKRIQWFKPVKRTTVLNKVPENLDGSE
jgi:hypothetical protein